MNKDLFNRLYFLLVTADEDVSEKEILLWKKIAELNKFQDDIHHQLNSLKAIDRIQMRKSCVQELKHTSKEQQINLMALLCLMANADGFMHKAEWELIYSIYHKELKLNQLEILETQRQLKKTLPLA